MMYKQRGFTIVEFYLVVFAVVAIGWIANFVQVILSAPIMIVEASTMWILKVIGILVPPLGVILGWIDIFS